MNNLKSSDAKNGFTIAEVLIVLAILGLFAVATAAIFSKKHQRPSVMSPHGQFECYVKDDGIVYQRLTLEENAGGEIVAGPVSSGTTKCIFTPPSKRIAYYMVALVGGGGSGSNKNLDASFTDYGGKKGEMKTMFFPEFTTTTVDMRPGAGGALPASGTSPGGTGGISYFNSDTITAAGGIGGTAEAVPVGGGGGGEEEEESPTGEETPPTSDTENTSSYVFTNISDYNCKGGGIIASATSSTGYLCVDTGDTTSIPIDTCTNSTYDTQGWANTYCYANHWAGLKSLCAASGKRLPTYAEITGPFRTDYLGANVGGFSSSVGTASSDEFSAFQEKIMNIGLNWGLNISKGSDPTYTRCTKETKNDGSKILCIDNTTTATTGDYLCINPIIEMPHSVSSAAKYQELYDFYKGSSTLNIYMYNSSNANYAVDYWYGALERCYDKDSKHNWRLPSYAEYILGYDAGILGDGRWDSAKYVSDSTMAYIGQGHANTLVTRNANAITYNCVRPYTPPPADVCVTNTITPQNGDKICIEGTDTLIDMGVSSQSKYTAMKTHYGAKFSNYYGGNAAMYSSDAWGKAIEKCYDKNSTTHAWRLPTTAELALLKAPASLSATNTYWAGPDTDQANSPNYLNGVAGSSTRSTKSNYVRCVASSVAPPADTCVDNTLTGTAGDRLCIESSNYPANVHVSSTTAYQALKDTYGITWFYSSSINNYASDYWAGALERCYNKDASHVWRLPSVAEFGILKGPASLPVDTKFWTSQDNVYDVAATTYQYNGGTTGLTYDYRYETGFLSRCVKETAPLADSVCVTNTLTPEVGDKLCAETSDSYMDAVSNSTIYTAMQSFYGSTNFTGYYDGYTGNYASDYWAGGLQRCYNKDASHVWRYPTVAEMQLIRIPASLTTGRTYWVFPSSTYDINKYAMLYGYFSNGTEITNTMTNRLGSYYNRCVKSEAAPPAEDPDAPSTAGEESGFDSYVKSGGYEFSTLITDDLTGNGGDAKAVGHQGGILIVW